MAKKKRDKIEDIFRDETRDGTRDLEPELFDVVHDCLSSVLINELEKLGSERLNPQAIARILERITGAEDTDLQIRLAAQKLGKVTIVDSPTSASFH